LLSNNLKSIVEQYYPLKFPISSNETDAFNLFLQFIFDPRNASLGDSLVNFSYSCAKSLAGGFITSTKLADKILVEGFKQSEISKILKLSGERKVLGNYLEAFFLAVWLFGLLSLDELISRIKEELDPQMLDSNIDENRTAIKAFARLFNICRFLVFNF
jgi:hypothetical protein